MRTNIEIDDTLMQQALRVTGAKTKREAVELGLKTLLQLRGQESWNLIAAEVLRGVRDEREFSLESSVDRAQSLGKS